MRSMRVAIMAALLTVAAFTVVTYTACKNACADVVCLNGGACQDGKCICPSGFVGVNCEKTPCSDVDCRNGGTCKDGKCLCPAGYEGSNCETPMVNKFMGKWNGQERCEVEQWPWQPYNITIEKGVTAADVKITGVQGNYTMYGAITSSNTIEVTRQPYKTSDEISGTFTLENNKLTFKFTYYGTTTYTCTGEYFK
ncbi:calcium-binding EGF-like domain-containing protein [Polluticoccus soli]|uniref:calcium-binding EGF-like domain-containing protein n=1 Tax=Polluticoccus soli TaxID=3034150 RepID=UPI0023E235FA|nr:calcium-binding EGF-like domain-containing protein [Flavipsychrobacter sp. JY13-12]